jgi:hypothetical protein
MPASSANSRPQLFSTLPSGLSFGDALRAQAA